MVVDMKSTVVNKGTKESKYHYSREELVEIFQHLYEDLQTQVEERSSSSLWSQTFKRLQETKSKANVLSRVILDENVNSDILEQKSQVTNKVSTSVPSSTSTANSYAELKLFPSIDSHKNRKEDANYFQKIPDITRKSYVVAHSNPSQFISPPNSNESYSVVSEKNSTIKVSQEKPIPKFNEHPFLFKGLDPIFRKNIQNMALPSFREYRSEDIKFEPPHEIPRREPRQLPTRFSSLEQRYHEILPPQPQESICSFGPSGFDPNHLKERVSRETLFLGNPRPDYVLRDQLPNSEITTKFYETQWLYLDPIGQLQGPFGGRQMQSWLECGFFPMIMQLKSENESRFKQLGDYIRLFGHQFFCLPAQTFLETPSVYASQQPYTSSYSSEMAIDSTSMHRGDFSTPSNVLQDHPSPVYSEIPDQISKLSLNEKEEPLISEVISIETNETIQDSTVPQTQDPPTLTHDSIEPAKLETDAPKISELTKDKQQFLPDLPEKKPKKISVRDDTKTMKSVKSDLQKPTSLATNIQTKSPKTWNLSPIGKNLDFDEIQRLEQDQQTIQQLNKPAITEVISKSHSASTIPFRWAGSQPAETSTKSLSLSQIQNEQEKELLNRKRLMQQAKNLSKESSELQSPVGWARTVAASLSSPTARSFLEIQEEQIKTSKLTPSQPIVTVADVLRGTQHGINSKSFPAAQQSAWAKPAPKIYQETSSSSKLEAFKTQTTPVYDKLWDIPHVTTTTKESNESSSKSNNKIDQSPTDIQQFRKWCLDKLGPTSLDVTTFFSFLLELETAKDIKEYIVDCLDEEKAVVEPQKFAEEFLQRRAQIKSLKPIEEYRTVVARKKKQVAKSAQASA